MENFVYIAGAGYRGLSGTFINTLLRLAMLGTAFSVASFAYAARPMITDDAGIVDVDACQVESWIQSNRGSTEYWALPACNFTGNLELTLGGGLTSEQGNTRFTGVQFQGKTSLKPLEANSWGIGLAAGVVHYRQAEPARDWYAYVPASFSFYDDALVVHTNIGWLREAETRRDHLTWGAGAEVRMAERTWLIAETFGQSHGRPFHQLGLRHWLVPNRVQLDATYGDRYGSRSGERWFSLGVRLLTVSFLS